MVDQVEVDNTKGQVELPCEIIRVALVKFSIAADGTVTISLPPGGYKFVSDRRGTATRWDMRMDEEAIKRWHDGV